MQQQQSGRHGQQMQLFRFLNIRKLTKQPFYAHNRDRVLFGIAFYSMLLVAVNVYIFTALQSDTTYVCI